jgi:hypothetical protein
VRLALTDPFDGNTAGWTPPNPIPFGLTELADAIAHLEARLIPATDQDFQVCMVAMIRMLALPDDGVAWEDRLKIYRAATEDIPPDLWEDAAMHCIKTCEFVPKVAAVRKVIEDRLSERNRFLLRARRLYDLAKTGQVKPAPVRDPEDVRLAVTIKWDILRSRPADARRSARRVAELRGLEPEAWAVDDQAPLPALVFNDRGHPVGYTPPTIEEIAAHKKTLELERADPKPKAPTPEDCPGHVASPGDPKTCGRCGVHIEELRPLEDEDPPIASSSSKPDPGKIEW